MQQRSLRSVRSREPGAEYMREAVEHEQRAATMTNPKLQAGFLDLAMLALILRRSSETPSNVFAPKDHHIIGQAVTIRRLRSYVVDATRCFGKSG